MSFSLRLKENGSHKELKITNSRNVLEILKENGIFTASGCGGSGICGQCNIELRQGSLQKQSTGEIISNADDNPIIIKSCHYSTLEDGYAVISICKSNYGPIKELQQFDVKNALRLFTNDKRIQSGKCSGKEEKRYSIAIDVGTTNVSGILAELTTGKILCAHTVLNKQCFYASDIISRIRMCSENSSNVKKFHNLIMGETIVPLIKQLQSQTRFKNSKIQKIVLAGNTVMLHLVCGIDPSSLGKYPFTPAFLESKTMLFEELIPGHFRKEFAELGKFETILLPSISAFIGADISSGLYALRIQEQRENILVIDIGTNGEIVLKTDKYLYGCSTAAGPVFEGFGLSSGMTATAGAVNSITLNNKSITISTIGSYKAVGICGTGYIAFLAEAWKHGLIDRLGRFNKNTISEYNLNFNEAKKSIDLTSSGIIITEEDISKLIQAKSAIASGVDILLTKACLTPQDVSAVYAAGAFGTEIRPEHIISSGLLKNFLPSQIRCAGNLSLAGAYISLFDINSAAEMESYKQNITVINLNEEPEFCDTFINNLSFN